MGAETPLFLFENLPSPSNPSFISFTEYLYFAQKSKREHNTQIESEVSSQTFLCPYKRDYCVYITIFFSTHQAQFTCMLYFPK